MLVTPGTYFENIDFEGKDIMVSFLYLLYDDSTYTDLTNIEGDEITSCALFESNEDGTSILNGFTLRGGLGYLADSDGDGDSYNYGGSAIFAFSNSNIPIQNSILWNNSPQEVMFTPWESFNYIEIEYSNVLFGEDGIVTNNNENIDFDTTNIEVQPLFCEPDSGDYSLAINSQCRHAGNNNENIRAYEIGCEDILSNNNDEISNKISIGKAFPKPFNPSLIIPFYLPNESHVTIAILNVLGKGIAVLTKNIWSPGQHNISYNASKFSRVRILFDFQ